MQSWMYNMYRQLLWLDQVANWYLGGDVGKEASFYRAIGSGSGGGGKR